MFMATKVDKMVTYLEGLLAIKSLYTLTICFCRITWQTKIFITPLLHCLWPQNLAGWWLTLTGFYLESHVARKITWQIKRFYLHYHSAYRHQTWQDDDLPWRALNLKSLMALWSRGLAKSRDKPSHHFHFVVGHKTWLTWRGSYL